MNATSSDEAARLAVLAKLDLGNATPEAELDAIAALAANVTGFQIGGIIIVGERDAWAKARHGIGALVSPRRHAFCDVVLASGEMLLVEDAAGDPRFAANVNVTGLAATRGYAGVPITVAGQRIGVLCVLDPTPRLLDETRQEALRQLGRVTEALIATRLSMRVAEQAARESAAATRRYRRQDRTFRQAERLARVGSYRYRLDDAQLEWSDEVYRIHGLEPGELPRMGRALDFYAPHHRGKAAETLAHTIETGDPFDVEADFITAKGQLRRIRSVGELEVEGGKPIAVIGVMQDVTERYRLEQSLRASANIDEVTSIANRASFNRALEMAMIRSGERGSPMMLAVIDLDDFKAINDTHGHMAGDDVLRAVGARLRQPWLCDSFAARLGGDEFALIIEHEEFVADPQAFAQRLSRALATPAITPAGEIPVSGTVGTAVLSDDIEAMRDLLHAADSALYEGKRRRRAFALRRRLPRAANE
ncbi:MAG: sensor diguanylate cyclase [Sphingomonas bacterium]|uniref:sensor domain-containing diguanylate cyclase n=1 Tax=Sphingomonas bacterium TaxID=1895847 RepID=UPI002630A98B|nr:diguanylate cyclase [Sphingomonas bacterium]MDB5710017.1 sensor diguanylate cyclase [Sphingomonas bacterium]